MRDIPQQRKDLVGRTKEEVHIRRKGHGLDKEAHDCLAGLTGHEPNRADVPAGEAGDQQEQPHQPVSLLLTIGPLSMSL